MLRHCWISVCLFMTLTPVVSAQQALPQALKLPGPLKFCTKKEVERLNRNLHGQILDFTRNHGADRRFYSAALGIKRNMYIYLPPDYDPDKRYPLMIWMHGILQDDKAFLDYAHYFDDAMAEGKLPQAIIAAPDGTIQGRATINAGSFYINSDAGRYGDYIVDDVWGFVTENFPVRREREANVLIGGSMGGFAAFHLAIKYHDRFGVAVGISPALNLRYSDCHGKYFVPFDPACTMYRETYDPHLVIGKLFGGLIRIHQKRLVRPLHGNGPQVIDYLASESPIEMLDSYDIRPGQLAMWVGYGTRDQFNLGAHCESFAHHAAERGLAVTVVVLPGGRHESATGIAMFPDLCAWLTPVLGPYSPPAHLYGPREQSKILPNMVLIKSLRR